MPSLVPVGHDPFAGEVGGGISLQPVEHDPFAGAAFGTGSPAEMSQQPSGLATLASGAYNYLGGLAKRSIESAARFGQTGEYDPAPIVEAAMLPMGTGAVAGVPLKAGEAVLGAGPIRAYHGSPHDFEKFSLDKIGTGEGAQAYGHGLYFAENPGVAQSYKTVGTKSAPIHYNGDAIMAMPSAEFDALPNITKQALLHTRYDTSLKDALFNAKTAGRDDIASEIERLRDSGALRENTNPGRMYEVDIKADPAHFLDYDKAIATDHPARAKLKELAQMGLDSHEYGVDRQLAKDAFVAADNPNLTGNGLYRQMTNAVEAARPKLKEQGNPKALFGGTAPLANEELIKAGIPGIKYLDQGSRAAGDGSRNYVVFNDKLIDIVRKYAAAGIALPPAIAMEFGQRFKPVDHDPFAPEPANAQ